MRYPDWDRRLRDAIEAAEAEPFRWGYHDCCLLAADLVRAMTGWDPAEGLRGVYGSELEAARIIRKHGGIAELISDLLGTAPVKPRKYERGDVVLLTPQQPGHLEQLGVCVGDRAVVAGADGILYRPMTDARRLWRLA